MLVLWQLCGRQVTNWGLGGKAFALDPLTPSSLTVAIISKLERAFSVSLCTRELFLSGATPPLAQVSQALLETVKPVMKMVDGAAGEKGKVPLMERNEACEASAGGRFRTEFLGGSAQSRVYMRG